jgi:DNA-binding Lrp family transcriptional regulator
MGKIDKFDLKLIQELEYNARESLSKIAKKLHSSQQVVSYRIKSLEKRKIIGGYYPIINVTKLGYTSYRTMIRLSNITFDKKKEIINYLIKNNYVLWIVDCGGRWDLIVNFMAKNILQYDLLLRNFKNKFPKQIQNYDVLPIIQVIYFGRDYFTKTKREIKTTLAFGENVKVIELDKINLKILDMLSENGRLSAVEIAGKLKISPNTVILRMKQMKKEKIIQEFKPLLHLENLGYLGYKALIRFQNLTEEGEKELINHLKFNVNIVGIIKLIGAWDLEIEFEVKTQEEMLELSRKVRDKFKDIINEFEIVPLFHEYKYNFFSRGLLFNQ